MLPLCDQVKNSLIPKVNACSARISATKNWFILFVRWVFTSPYWLVGRKGMMAGKRWLGSTVGELHADITWWMSYKFYAKIGTSKKPKERSQDEAVSELMTEIITYTERNDKCQFSMDFQVWRWISRSEGILKKAAEITLEDVKSMGYINSEYSPWGIDTSMSRHLHALDFKETIVERASKNRTDNYCWLPHCTMLHI